MAKRKSSRELITPTRRGRGRRALTDVRAAISFCFRGDQVDAEVAFSSMLARRQELNTQLQQLIDSVLLALSLVAAHSLRYYSTAWFDLTTPIDPFRNYQ